APIDYLRLFRPLYQYVDFFTVNLCDNSSDVHYVPTDKDEVMAILTPLFEFRRGQNQYRPILIKISPDLTDEQIDAMTDIMLDTPLDGIVATGGTTGRYGLENSKETIHSLGRIPGALCGSPLKERSLQVVRRIYERSKGTYPIIGCGGINTADDAFEMIKAGATLVELYSSFYYGGGDTLRNIRTGLNERLRKLSQNAAHKEIPNQTNLTEEYD
ncbi:MAG: quinone-dependent dihydroorotate dehydrogenase, partial [Alistipes sp.]|nr:quinone-dependent dihydroorotate dehydrogenase [Alistipes sp.]